MLKLAIENEELKKIKQIAHKMRSSCSGIGLSEVSVTLRNIEELAMSAKEQLPKIRTEMISLESIFEQAIIQIKNRLLG